MIAGLLVRAPALAKETAPSLCPDAIPVAMYDRVDSATTKPGNVFRFRVLQTTTVNGGRFATGTFGYGVVRAVSTAGRHDVYGSLAIEPRYLVLAFGKQQQVTMDPHLPAIFTSATPNLERAAGRVPLPVPGIAMSAVGLVRFGKNVTLGPGFRFYVVPLFDLGEATAC